MSNTTTDLLSQVTNLPKEEIQKTSGSNLDRIFEATGQKSAPGYSRPATGGPVNAFDIAAKAKNVSAIYTDPLENYRESGVPLNPFVNLNEERAQRQSTWDKWVNGLTKAGITTLGAVYENTVGVFAGLGSLATGGEYYDNFVGKQVDSVNNWAQKNLPNYYTQAEQDASVLAGLGTANFWADKVANGLGYTLGSIATMWLGTGELGLAGKAANAAKSLRVADSALDIAGLGAKASKAANVVEDAALVGSRQLALYRAGKAVETGQKLENLAQAARISTATQRLAVATQMSLAESSVEARETKTRYIDEQVAKWQEENPGGVIPEDVMAGIEESANAAGNVAFAINLPILAASNLIMFRKMFMGAAIGEKQMYNATRDATGKLVEAGMEGKLAKAWTKSTRLFGSSVRNMGIEGFQEGSQFAASEFSRDYYGDKFSDGVGDMSKSLSESLSATFGSKEGLENILIGAIIGGGTGAVSRIAGADSKLAKARTANTAKVLEYINSGGLTKVLENMESNAYNQALSNVIEENNKILSSPTATPVQKAIARQRSERARVQIIRSEVARLDKMGGTDYLMEQLDDAATMPEEEFKKAFGYRMDVSLQKQTGKTQGELVQDVKDTAELSLKRSRQVQDILAKYQPKNTLLPKLIASFQNEETKQNKQLQGMVINQYASFLHRGLMDIDVLDKQIDDIYSHLVKISPSMGQIAKEDFVYKIKVGEIVLNEDGTIGVSGKTTSKTDEKLFEKLNQAFQAKYALNPADAEEFQDTANVLSQLVGRREQLVTSFDNIRRNPEQMDLYVEAEYVRRQQEEKQASADRAAQVVENAETADEIREAMPDDAPAEIVAQAQARVEELEQKEKEERVKFTSMTDDMLDAIDEDSLPPIAAAALAKERDVREKKRLAEKTVEAQNGQLQRRDEFAPTADYTEFAQELSDAEEAALGNISVSPGGFIFTINGRAYLNLNESITDAILYDENGVRIGVRLTDAATGNLVTWLLDDQNEEDSAIADTITYAILVQAASIRDVEAIANMSAEEFKEILRIRGEAVTKDVLEKHKKEVAAQEDTLGSKAKQFETLDSLEDPEEIAQIESQFEKLIDSTDIGKTAGLTDGQLRNQIEVIKQDLIEMDEILAAERQVAMEAGFTEAEFNTDGNVKTLKALKKSHKALLNKKIKELAKRKKRATVQEATDQEVIAEEIEQAPLEEEVDEITQGEEAKISRLEDEIAQLKLVESELQKIADGTYPGQDIGAAKKEIRNTQSKIKRREENIRKSKELIQRINEEREAEKLREAGNTAEGTDTTVEGQESERTDIDPRAGSTTEGLDGTTTAEELEEIRRLREQQEQIDRTMDEPSDGRTDTQADPEEPKVTIVVAEGPVNAPLSKGEINSNDDFTEQAVDDNGNVQSSMPTQKVNGDEVAIYPEMLTDNDITPAGTIITFEVDESTEWWNSEDPKTRNNKKDLTEDRYWEQVPIYVVAQLPNGQVRRVGSLAAYKADENSGLSRKDIYNLHKQGITAASTISRKLLNSKNIANARVASMYSYGEIFFYPSSNITKGSPKIAVVRIKDGIPTFVDQSGNVLEFNANNVVPGQVAIIAEDPNGNPALVMASTKSMTEEGRTIAVNHLIKENPEAQLFGEIVGLNKLPVEVADENDRIDLNEGEDISKEDYENYMSQVTLTDGKVLFSFYSKSANKLVRINEEELKKALLGQSFKFTFSEVGTNEKGWKSLVTVKGEKAEYARVSPNLKQEFLDIIMNKKYQVDINKIRSTDPYVSALTGIEYPTYFEYLNSDKEFTEPRTQGLGANVILATDSPGNVYKSPFFDVGIEFTPLTGIGGGVATQAQLEVSDAVKVLDSIEAPVVPILSIDAQINGLEKEKERSIKFGVNIINNPESTPEQIKSAQGIVDQISAAYDKQIADLRKSQPAPQPAATTIKITSSPSESSPMLKGEIITPDGKGNFTVKVLEDGTAYIYDIQLGDFQESDKTKNKGYGLQAYIQIGQEVQRLGYTLESTHWAKHTAGISPQALRVWEKLVEKGYAEVTGTTESKVYNRETGNEEVKTINIYKFKTPGAAVATTTQPATPVTGEKIIEAKFAQQGTSFEIEVRGVNRDFLLTWNRNNPKASLFSEKTKNGEYTTSLEYPSEEAIKKLVDKYIPESLVKLIDKWTAASKLPAGQVLNAQESIEKEINVELAKLKGKPATTPTNIEAKKAAIEKKYTFTRESMDDISEGTALAKKGAKITNPDKVTNQLSIGDKVEFFAERKRTGVWNGKSIIEDGTNNSWGVLGILSSTTDYIKNQSKIDAELAALESTTTQTEAKVEARIERRQKELQEELNKFGTSVKQTEKNNIPVLLDPAAKARGEKQAYVSRELMELAYKNDIANQESGQDLDTIIRRGGYSSKELSELLKPEVDRINAELDALGQPAAQTTSNSQTIEQGGKTYTVTFENGNGVIRNNKGNVISGNSSIGSAVLDKVNWDTLEEGPKVSTTPAVVPAAPVPIAQSTLDVAVDEAPADLFGPAPKAQQNSVSLNELPAALAHLRPSPEQQAQLKAEMEAELRGLNPMGGVQQNLSDLMREASQAGENKKKEC